MNEKTENVSLLSSLPKIDKGRYDLEWKQAHENFRHKILVLDDDPTGVQTVHGVPVYTDWTSETIDRAFKDEAQLVFILTNSRSFSTEKTACVHKEIAERVEVSSLNHDQPYLLISRSDSTLRGHYPLETETMKEKIEESSDYPVDGEIIIPHFAQGGRFTINNIHYVKSENKLIPVGETEFAQDKTFGFQSSHLGEYIEEKTKGEFPASSVTYISLDQLRQGPVEHITDLLCSVSDFNKLVVNAVDEEDVKVFTLAMLHALEKEKKFLVRSGATFTKLIANISTKPLLSRDSLITEAENQGGLVMVGSHVNKTTEQLKELQKEEDLHFIEFNCHLVFERDGLLQEAEKVRREAEEKVQQGITTVIYTSRELIDEDGASSEEKLAISVDIANTLTGIVRNFSVRPAFLIAKGGITSSNTGTNGLKVKRALVAGQIAPGVPVWKTGEESTFPGLPYVIFPGNVGDRETLREVVKELC
ncbi:four-carbon acid sugar kinase family protein [Alteribacter natronophilus]|uniref:four-carbon acid sugar kinase family protein n=1 Tax=Alteribacter natronophilus TaxID=2583810 RepID=UPI00110F4447|nr:four-carbon acid sugar kinase family protein [Alteribacter natronophilus]TMW72254.1 hydroxyacid dehydrogenase [Alteribacter natronophilus]